MTAPVATPRRNTISTYQPTRSSESKTPTRPGTCTHMTMTRLYTKYFCCAICARTGDMGWLYRCTQDRELLIEHDMEYGREVSGKTPTMD